MTDYIPFRLLLALLIGAFIGLEREIHEKNEKGNKGISFLGLRTFTLTTTLGAIAGYIYHVNTILFTVIAGVFSVLTVSYYLLDSLKSKDIGLTTEIALVYSFVIGALITMNIFPFQLIVGISVVLVFILSRKKLIREYIEKINQKELGSFISYLVLALVILPLLPDTSIRLSGIPGLSEFLSSLGLNITRFTSIEILNPFKLWLIVALITGVDVFGYILERTIGQKGGWLLTSFAGGFISSTATTQSLALQSKKAKSVNHLVSAAVFANFASFIQHIVIIFPISLLFFTKVFPVILSMLISSLIISFYFLKKKKGEKIIKTQKTGNNFRQAKLFNLAPALKFALLFITIKFLSQIALQIFGNNGFFLSIIFGSIPGTDAVLISVAELTLKNLNIQTALWAFIIVNSVNLITKSIYCFTQGKKEFALKFTFSVFIIMLSGVFGMIASTV